jgi:GT2 family glycosyltransferase
VTTEKDNPKVRLEGPFSFRASFFSPFVRHPAASGNDAKGYHNSDYVIGTAMLIQRDVLIALAASTGEYFPTDLFFAGEEQVFCFRAKRMSFAIVMARDVVVEHWGARSAGGRRSTLMYYYRERNSVLAARKLLPFYSRIAFYALNLSFAAGRVTKNLLQRRPRAVWAVLQGVLDGYRGRAGKWKYHDREALGAG